MDALGVITLIMLGFGFFCLCMAMETGYNKSEDIETQVRRKEDN